jgi:hypothetical protein
MNMHKIAVNNIDSMCAMHLAHRDTGKWYKGFEEDVLERCWKAVVSPIVIASQKPVGYSPTWPNNPLSCSQTFTLFKQFNAVRPYHNAFTKYSLNPGAAYRNMWCDCIVIPSKTYGKSKFEIRRKVCVCLSVKNQQ